MIPVAQIQHGHVLSKLSWRQVVEQGVPLFTVNQEHNALFPHHDRGDSDDLRRSIGKHGPQRRAWGVRNVIGAETINERNSITASYEKDADIGAKMGERHP